jgi:hypothetical protein
MTEADWLAIGETCKQAALDGVRRGWSVISLCHPTHVGYGIGGHAKTCGSPGKSPWHPWKQYQSELADAEQVAEWWRLRPMSNLGLVLGEISGLIGIDIDGDIADGQWRALAQGIEYPTWEFATGGGGRRLFFAVPKGMALRTISHKTGEAHGELRILCNGSQTVMPPSLHISGRQYTWLEGRSPDDLPVADAPEWLLAMVRQNGPTPSHAAPLTDAELVTEGGRNQYLTKLAGSLRRIGATEATIRAALLAENEARIEPPLEIAEVEGIVQSIRRYEPDPLATVTLKLPGTEPAAPVSLTDDPWGDPVPWSKLLPAADDQRWVWKGFLAKHHVTLFSAAPKTGKTTLVAALLGAFANAEEFVGQPIKRGAKVLYITEEHESLWHDRAAEVDGGDCVHFYCQKNQSRMNEAQWIERLSFIRKRIDTEGYDLVVFDTLASIWSAKDENDAVGVQASLMPLRTLPCAVLIIHHTRKAQHGDSEDGSAARGSSALTGFVDLILELKRWKAGHRQRLLLAKGRFPSSVTPEESVIERTKDEKSFVLVGNRNEVTEAAEKEALLAAIPYGEPGATVEEIGDTLNGEGPSRTRLFGELKKLQADQLLGRSGTGKKGSPWVFWRLKGMGVVPNNCSIKFEKDVC